VNRFLLAAHINAHDTAYSPDWWGLPVRTGLAAFVIALGVIASFGVSVAPEDPPVVTNASVITSDGPALCGGQR
jgi:hypothetical protein